VQLWATEYFQSSLDLLASIRRWFTVQLMTKTKQSILSLAALNQANKENSSFYFWMLPPVFFLFFEDNPLCLDSLKFDICGSESYN
jgi:hypothetical protein